MQIHISTADGVPIYLQIVNQLKYLVAAGRLSAGEEIPPHSRSCRTIARKPEHRRPRLSRTRTGGIVIKKHGSGTYISDSGSPLARKERLKILHDRADALLAEASHLGVSMPELLEIVKQRGVILNPSKK